MISPFPKNAYRWLTLSLLGVNLAFAQAASPTPAPATPQISVGETAASPGQPIGAPRIAKLEPPNWWTALTPEVMVMLSGENLQGATVLINHVGVKVTRTEEHPEGDYLFVWLQLAPSLKPAKIVLNVRAKGGNAIFSYPLLARNRSQVPLATNRSDVIYLILPDRFADGDPRNNQPTRSMSSFDRKDPHAYHGGDLKGIRDHLPYLHELGITTLWLTPILKNTESDYHGYHIIDFYSLDDHMGSLSEYQELVRDAHRLGMKVLIDYVANYTGPKHPWVKDPPTASWYHGTPEKHLDASFDFAAIADPHSSARQYRSVLEGWLGGRLPDLNSDDPVVEQYLQQNALWWTQTAGLDGFRLDTFPNSSLRFWSSWHKYMRRTYPNLTSIAEVSGTDPSVNAYFEGPQSGGLDSGATTMFDYPLSAVLRDVMLGAVSIQRLIDVLRQDSIYVRPDLLVTFIGNHDQPRFMSQTGASKEKLKLAFSLLCTLRGIPQIYAGDELGLTGGGDPDNRRDFPGGFAGDPQNAFTAQGRTPDQREIFNHLQMLLKLREAHPALRSGHQWHVSWDGTYYAFVRQTPEEKLLVLFNNSPAARELTLQTHDTPVENATKLQSIFGTAEAQVLGETVRTTLPPSSVSIFLVK